MVCEKCKVDRHGECPGETWCDCQHRVPEVLLGVATPPPPETEPEE